MLEVKDERLLLAVQQLLHIARSQADVLENLFGAGTLKVLDPGLENQLMLMFARQLLLLNQGPAGFIHEKPKGVIERFEEILAPAPVSRMPEPGEQDSGGWRLIGVAHPAGHHDNKMTVVRRGQATLLGR